MDFVRFVFICMFGVLWPIKYPSLIYKSREVAVSSQGGKMEHGDRRHVHTVPRINKYEN